MANLEQNSKNSPIYLASASPRRRMLLEDAGFILTVLPSHIPEVHVAGEGFADYSLRNATEKALHVAKFQIPKDSENGLVIGADTIVVASNGTQLLEKPNDANQAKGMLSLLSENWHEVITSYVIFCKKTCILQASRSVSTKVLFRKLFDDEMDRYIASGEPYDKAGGYGIQGAAMGFVSRVDGSYTNVMGLPLAEVIGDIRAWELKQESKID